MKAVFAVNLFILFATSIFAQSNNNPALAKSYTELFFSRKFQELFDKMDPTMQKTVKGVNGLAEFYSSVVSIVGVEPMIDQQQVSAFNGQTISRQTVKGKADGNIEVTWVLNDKGAVTGFSVIPKDIEAPSKYLNYDSKTKLRLPFDGTWTVFSGGKTIATNHHAISRSQRFASDLAIIKNGSTFVNSGKELSDYYVWGKKVLAPADGVIVFLADGFSDNPIGSTDAINPGGNYLVIDHGNNEFSFLAHFQKNSFAVKKGDKVKSGQTLGLVGNSGNTSEPHLHYHLQDGPHFPESESMPPTFYNYKVDGKLIKSGQLVQGSQVEHSL